MPSTAMSPITAIVLAAGEGTRMRSARPKVLHEVAGRSLVGHVLDAVKRAGIARIAVVMGPDRSDVAHEVARRAPDAKTFVQRERRGTAHAVLAARDALIDGNDLLVLFGDTPLVRSQTIARLRDTLSADGAAVALLGFEAADPTGYGRLVRNNAGHVVAIREEREASDAERKITLCNGGLMAIAGAHAVSLLDAIDDRNSKSEFYLTDVVAGAVARGLGVSFVVADEEDVLGINDRQQLAAAEAVLQSRLRATAMMSGVTLVDPATTFLSVDTEIDADVTIEPHVVIGPGVSIARGTVIHAFSHLAGAKIGEDCSVGPFARLRPGTILGTGAKIGNFVETKTAAIEPGAKVSHLSYIGDARVGAKANIGAGTITCNYDGFAKYRTDIGAGAFVGSNSALVAPVRIGAGAFVASGSVVTHDVEPDALAVARGQQIAKAGWATAFRAKHAKPKR